MSLLRDRAFLAAASAHFGVDLLNSQKALILAFLSAPLGLSNSLIGLINTLYTLSASLSQPLFGALADRFGPRWVAAGGTLWLGGFFGAAVLASGYTSLGLLVLAALGSAAFHPAGTLEASLVGREGHGGGETTATSVFFLFGQAGLSLGPALGGPILDRWGTPGLLLLLLIVLPVGANAGMGIRPLRSELEAAFDKPGNPSRSVQLKKGLLAIFVLLAASRTWVQFNFLFFLPKYYADLDYRPALYGLIAALFMGAGAVGNVSGGWLGDRYDRKLIVIATLLAAVIPIALFPRLGPTGWTYLLTPLIGLLVGASHSIIVVTAQDMMPDRMGAASGLVLGFMFASASVGTLLSGWIADQYSFEVFFWTTAALALIAAGLGNAVPTDRPTRA